MIAPTGHLAPSKRRTVGLFIESSHGSGRALLMGIGRFVRAHPQWSVYWEPTGFEMAWPPVKSVALDGLIVRDGSFSENARELRIPTVVFGHLSNEWSGAVNIVADAQAIGCLAAEHFLSRGFRHFAYIDVFNERIQAAPGWSLARRAAFEARVNKGGFTCFVFDDARSKTLRGRTPEVIAEWLRWLPKPVGCMAANDALAGQILHACRIANLRVPEDVAIIGVDNDEMLCGFCNPTLSSVSVNFERAGYEAAEALDGWMRTSMVPNRDILASANFVAGRRSTDVVAVADENLAKALRYIDLHFRRGALPVDEIAGAAALSRRTLERCFRREIGRTVQDHVRHLRIAEITRAMVETNLSIVKIAQSVGFEDAKHFSRYFRASQGVSPQAYRKYHRAAQIEAD